MLEIKPRALTAHTEWLSGVRVRMEELMVISVHSSVVEHWQLMSRARSMIPGDC